MLSATVYRKPTHTDRYLHYSSHHPTSVLRGVVRSLFDRAKKVTTYEEDLQKENEHLNHVFTKNGYPSAFIHSASERQPARKGETTSNGTGEVDTMQDDKKSRIITIPYIVAMSEDIRRICRRFDIKVAFKSGQTLRSQLSRVKERLPTMMRSSVVYKIPCTCGKVYIGETTKRLETRVREHQNACRSREFDKSAIAEHAWTDHHPILWDDISVLDRASRWRELLIKEALHI